MGVSKPAQIRHSAHFQLHLYYEMIEPLLTKRVRYIMFALCNRLDTSD
ncbi:hypothetical protein [Hyphomonas sp. UBA5107]|nr:hypothetical protein [Hyphomonas sp. UBA5107]